MNNNESMATVVETFLVEETIELIHDNDKLRQWNERVAELGLEGQLKVITAGKSPIPFLHMKQPLVNACSTLCPVKVDVALYDKQPIPVDILDMVALARREEHFDFIQIWYDDVDPDPFCIGLKKNVEWDNNFVSWSMDSATEKYLMGRWGGVKMSLDAIVAKARVVFRNAREAKLKGDIQKLQRSLGDLDADVEERFGSAMPPTDLTLLSVQP